MKRYISYRKRMRIIALISTVFAVILAAVLYILVGKYNEKELMKMVALHKLDIQVYEDMRNQDDGMDELLSDSERELQEKMKTYDFYQKIEEKLTTNIAFFGTETVRKMKNDNTGWVAQFFDTMKKNYTNAHGINSGSRGSSALYGYVALNIRALQSFEYFDLAVVCYGAHDDPETFTTYYDGLLRSIKNQNEKCEIYCIIEANKEGYNENAEAVRQICALYGGICIDMNEYFKENGIDFDATLNGIEPNSYGDKEYLSAILETIDSSLESGRRVSTDKRVNFSSTRDFDNFKYLGTAKMKKVSDTVYEFSSSGKIAVLVYKIDPKNGENTKIYVNGKRVLNVNTKYGSSDELGIALISTSLGNMNRIRIETGTDDNAMNIYGIAIGGSK
ncbi:MAG: SGNH/GDSL hydrolase family protein [Clostridia bacterium]|nr:SGNH/GDSL hydrolase family protein [Clostridia bacterium]